MVLAARGKSVALFKKFNKFLLRIFLKSSEWGLLKEIHLENL
jgi:hypothetical protein